jgi:hypothetical protein
MTEQGRAVSRREALRYYALPLTTVGAGPLFGTIDMLWRENAKGKARNAVEARGITPAQGQVYDREVQLQMEMNATRERVPSTKEVLLDWTAAGAGLILTGVKYWGRMRERIRQ